jgi:small subunit ribosomal protein S6
MRNYEVTFIVDPVLSTEEIKATAQTYVEHLESSGCKIVAVEDAGLRQLAYPIKKRNSGIYYTIEFKAETGALIVRFELALRRDERIMRFLTTALDKYGVKYNEDKRNGLIGKARKQDDKKSDAPRAETQRSEAPQPEAKKTEAPKPEAKSQTAEQPESKKSAEVTEEAPKPEAKKSAEATEAAVAASAISASVEGKSEEE